MHKSMPLHWIEQAEKNQMILNTALFHPSPKPATRRPRARSAIKDFLDVLSLGCTRLAELTLLPPAMVQPIPVRVRRRDDHRRLQQHR